MEFNQMTMEIFSKLEQQWLSTTTAVTDSKKTRILTIDGGGTSAATVGAFLVHLEETIQNKAGDSTARIVDFFDIISGTGIGAVLAVLINTADSATGRPLYSARDAVSFLSNNAGKLFKPRRCGVLRRRSNHRCSAESLESTLKLALKNASLKETCKPILIPCYDIASSAPFVFSRAAACASSLDFELSKVCCTAIATPPLFSPFSISSVDGKISFSAVDGGIVMNNPAIVAITHVLHNKIEFPTVNGVEDLLLLSLGNGNLSCRGIGENWSGESKEMVKWVVDVAANGVSETVDQMLGNAFSWNRHDYVRIQANGLDGSGLMTREKALKERGIESLTFGGKRLLAEINGDRIEGFAQRLVTASAKSSLPPSPYKSLSPLLDGR